jgi:hypothetical protein
MKLHRENNLNTTSYKLSQYKLNPKANGLFDPYDALMLYKELGYKEPIQLSGDMARSNFLAFHNEKYNKRLYGLTPLWLYFIKDSMGIKYSRWDTTSKYFTWLFGSNILAKNYLEYQQNPKFFQDLKAEISEKSRLDFANGKKLTDWPLKGVVNKKIMYILAYQLWLANVATRIPDAYILDFDNLDFTPEPIDAVLNVNIREDW